ncbi:membrane protein insertase YidC [Lysinibacter sp. HNR]|uniref:membrane protein insertase YidC n=1 Tax=Lysinibacter sp. HNR TaxID=3031408 RepID=UPI002434C86D|nr:membrane protein insertase YidC [Lysinibacter sp. HNR]WGD37341.1 membrane protein insertase YidC [Lysinibacter sp. HNR]
MEFLDTILWPIRWVIELIIVAWHYFFTWIGLDSALGITWILSIVGLVVVVRAALIPLFVRQIKSQRRMMEISPQLKKIQDKYKGKKDQFSREAMSRETMALYKNNGTSPFASCLPLLAQMPIFFGLFSVLRTASDNKAGVGLMTEEFAAEFGNAEIFGAPLKATLMGAINGDAGWQVIVVAAILVVFMIASQFYTQLQITAKNVSEETKNSPMYRQQKILLYVIPFMFVFSGVTFPLGLNFYWFSSNLWSMVQQFIIIRQLPTPGSAAFRERQERLARKGKLEKTDDEAAEEAATVQKTQRQQPINKKRAKKKSGKPGKKS